MEEVRQLVQEEGREARNLVAFHVSVDPPGRPARKPPRSVAPRAAPRPPRRSASAGRDKRTELRARYWALLFGDLQRAVGEIYNTVEAHENLSECQEVVLVLENYTRDFKALCEWFRLKWEYDNTPPPQRPHSLAWEIRKTDFVRPESRRAGHSVRGSPPVSGKNSPCLSGRNTPSGKHSPVAGKTSPGGKVSPRVAVASPKGNGEFFGTKVAAGKVAAKPEVRVNREGKRLSDIKEKVVLNDSVELAKEPVADAKVVAKADTAEKVDVVESDEFTLPDGVIAEVINNEDNKTAMNVKVTINDDIVTTNNVKVADNENNKTTINVKVTNNVDCKTSNNVKVTNDEDNKTTNDVNATNNEDNKTTNNVKVKKSYDNKTINNVKVTINDDKKTTNNGEKQKRTVKSDKNIKCQVETVDHLNKMENEFLVKQWMQNSVKNSIMCNDEPIVQKKAKTEDDSSESPVKSDDNFADVSGESNVDEHIKKGDFKRPETPNDATMKETTNNNDCRNIETLKPIDENTQEVSKELLADKETKSDTDKKEVKAEKTRPAYSQAAAKPKATSAQPKPEAKTAKATPVVRSKTVVDINTNDTGKVKWNAKKNTAKCSYPFNRTTGRDAGSVFLSISVSQGDKQLPLVATTYRKQRNQPVVVQKEEEERVPYYEQPPPPTPSPPDTPPPPEIPPPRISKPTKGTEKEREKVNLALEKFKTFDECSSSETVVTQIDTSRMESSESLRTLIADESNGAGSVEVLNTNTSATDNEGWCTVRSKRIPRESKKPKTHWSNRFNQPSATTSLPTLNMAATPERTADRAQSEQKEKKTPKSKERKTSMIRQKSDMTGLKTKSRGKAAKKERLRGKIESDATVRLHSSLESLTGQARSQESSEDKFDFDKWKKEFKLYSKYLEEDEISDHKEILSAADPTEVSRIAEMTSQIEENERKISLALDFQSEVDQKKLCAEEASLNRQIMELQDADLGTETDDTETESELPVGPAMSALAASLEEQYASALRDLPWTERVDTLVALQALVVRDPGRAQELHAKLSQGIRRGSLQDALRRLQAKQSRAERHRRDLQSVRSRKIQTLLARVEEVKVAKNQIIEDKRARMERRLKRAAENRDQYIKDIVRKAHDEEEKLREIAFIKQLDAENRRHEFLEQCRSHNSRLRGMRREQLARLEQKSAREAAVGARRMALEEARRQHVESLVEKRKERDARVEELKEQKKQERDDAAREKAEGVKSRLSALALAAQRSASLLRSRITDKQRATQLRRAQCMRARAAARHQTTSESQEQPTTEEDEQDRATRERKERERQKAMRKRARKLRTKLLQAGDHFEAISCESIGAMPLGNTKFGRLMNQINNIIKYITRNIEIKKNINQNNGTETNEGQDKRKGKKRTSDNKKPEDECADSDNDNDCKEVNKENTQAHKNDTKKGTKDKESEQKVDVYITMDRSDGKSTKTRRREKRESMSENKPEKLSKSSSAASSVSDMSKVSANAKSDKNGGGEWLNIDWFHVEKLINELHRMMDKIDKKDQEMLVYGLKSLTQLLLLTAEREETGVLFTTKTLYATVCILTRVVATCPQASAYFVSINASVHLATLLSVQLEKDLSSAEDPLEVPLCRGLCECLQVCFACVLAAPTREGGLYGRRARGPHNDGARSGRQAEKKLLAECRARAHGIISYMCLSGAVARAGAAAARAVRDDVHALLTLCLELCRPSELDAGQDRQSASDLLLASLGRALCGARAALCCAEPPAPAPAAGRACEGAATTVRAARLALAVGRLDHVVLQNALGEGGWALEFAAAVQQTLSQLAPSDAAPAAPAPAWPLNEEERETFVLDVISLVGFFVVNNEEHQAVCNKVLSRLNALPSGWVAGPQRRALLPALAAFALADLDIVDDYVRSDEAKGDRLVQIILDTRKKNNKTGKK